MGLSMHAMSSSQVGNTIKLRAEFERRPIFILVDSGTTHSFLDSEVANELKVIMIITTPLTVIVANGHKSISNSLCS